MKINDDLTTGNITQSLIRLTLPLLASMFLETLFNLVDAIWVGRSGVTALAAVNLASFPIWMMFAFAGIVTTGTNALVAQKLGEATYNPSAAREAKHVAGLGITMSLVFGTFLAVVVMFWGRDLLSIMAGNNQDMLAIVDLSFSYLGFVFLFAPIHAFNEVICAILRAYGDTKTPLKVFSVGFILNFILDPLFIFGYGPIPRWGVFGAALATNLAFFVVTLIFVYLIATDKVAFSLLKKHPKVINFGHMKRLVGIGFPPSLASMVFSGVYMGISPAISSFGPDAMAALGIGHRMEGFTYSVSFGIALATITMVGQNIGAGRIDRVIEVAWKGIACSAAVNVTVALTFVLIPDFYAGVFVSDSVVRYIAADYLRILAISQVFAGVACVIEGVFAGAGRTLPPMLVSIPCALARIPAVYMGVFMFNFSINNLWWTISLLTCLRGLLTAIIFKKGLWKPKEVVPAKTCEECG